MGINAPASAVAVCLCYEVARLHVHLGNHAVVVANCEPGKGRGSGGWVGRVGVVGGGWGGGPKPIRQAHMARG